MRRPGIGPQRRATATDGRYIHAEDVARARDLLDGVDHEALADLFDALSDATRVRIVHVLLRQEMSTSDLATTLRLSDPAISQHLRVLRNLRLVDSRRAGRMVYYRVVDRHIARLVEIGLKHQGYSGAGERLGRPQSASATA